MWKNLSKYNDAALLFLRVTLGIFFIVTHGWKALAGGLATWKAIGATMKYVGITFWPGFWGFIAAFAESVGVGLLVVGLLFRPSALLLTIVIALSVFAQYRGHSLHESVRIVELSLVFLLLFIGPGKFSVDKG